MASVIELPEGNPNELIVYIRTEGLVAASDAAQLLQAVDRAFRSFVRDEFGVRGHLKVAETGVGSFWSKLVLAGEIAGIASAASVAGVLPMFANNIAYTTDMLLRGDFEDIPGYMFDLIRTAARVGRRARASAIEFTTVVRVALDPIGFDLVIVADNATKAQKRRDRNQRAAGLPTAEGEAMFKTPEESNVVKALVEKGELYATVFWAGGRWYGRPPDMDDVMYPLQMEASVGGAPQSGHDYRIKGIFVMNAAGHPIAIRVNRLTSVDGGDPPLGLPKPR